MAQLTDRHAVRIPEQLFVRIERELTDLIHLALSKSEVVQQDANEERSGPHDSLRCLYRRRRRCRRRTAVYSTRWTTAQSYKFGFFQRNRESIERIMEFGTMVDRELPTQGQSSGSVDTDPWVQWIGDHFRKSEGEPQSHDWKTCPDCKTWREKWENKSEDSDYNPNRRRCPTRIDSDQSSGPRSLPESPRSQSELPGISATHPPPPPPRSPSVPSFPPA